MNVNVIRVKKNRLNPYSTGIWSATLKSQAIDLQTLKT